MKKTLLCWLAALGAAAVIPACGGAAGDKSLSGLDRERFRSEVNGRPTDLYTLTNAAGMEVCITNFGGRIVGQWGRKGTQVGVEPFAGEKQPSARLLRSAEGRWKLFREGQAFS